MKRHQIYTRKRHKALAKSLEKYIKLQKNMDNFSGAVCGAVGLAESFLLILAYTKLGEASSVFFLYFFMIIDIALVAGLPFLFGMKIFRKIASCFPETEKLATDGRNDLARDIIKIMADSGKSPEQAYLECRKKIYLSIDRNSKTYLKLFKITFMVFHTKGRTVIPIISKISLICKPLSILKCVAYFNFRKVTCSVLLDRYKFIQKYKHFYFIVDILFYILFNSQSSSCYNECSSIMYIQFHPVAKFVFSNPTCPCRIYFLHIYLISKSNICN